jgi:hypothetical protein
MSDARRLALVRGIHTGIYLVMVGAILVLLYAGGWGCSVYGDSGCSPTKVCHIV